MSWFHNCSRAEIMANHPKSSDSDATGPVSNGSDSNGSDEKLYLFDKPKNVQRLMRGFYVCCVLLVLAEFVIHRHIVHPWEWIFGFHALYGFVACVVLVLIATQLRTLLMRDEDYYDDPGGSDSDTHSKTDKLSSDQNGEHDNVGC